MVSNVKSTSLPVNAFDELSSDQVPPESSPNNCVIKSKGELATKSFSQNVALVGVPIFGSGLIITLTVMFVSSQLPMDVTS